MGQIGVREPPENGEAVDLWDPLRHPAFIAADAPNAVSLPSPPLVSEDRKKTRDNSVRAGWGTVHTGLRLLYVILWTYLKIKFHIRFGLLPRWPLQKL